ncbi:MAG: nucleotidyltransferase family protein [Pseudomonadota bacterium]
MMRNPPLLVSAFRNPQFCLALTSEEWDLLIRQARAANVLATLNTRLMGAQLLDEVPAAPRRHLQNAARVAERLQTNVRWELHRICEALFHLAIPIVALKGAAYVIDNAAAAPGRTFNDIDILVPKSSLDLVEHDLKLAGWVATHHNEYDQRYYRQWMHELPPLRHITRMTVIDVHHALLPETARLRPDPNKVVADAVETSINPDLYVPSSIDQFLHSACHLFHEGEFSNGFRDLLDLDALYRTIHASDPTHWATLCTRAEELELTRPLYYALSLCRRILQTPLPGDCEAQMANYALPAPFDAIMSTLFSHALAPSHRSCDRFLTGPARWLLYVRSHYMRMPLRLLIPHLLRKAVRGEDE